MSAGDVVVQQENYICRRKVIQEEAKKPARRLTCPDCFVPFRFKGLADWCPSCRKVFQ